MRGKRSDIVLFQDRQTDLDSSHLSLLTVFLDCFLA